MAGPIIALTTDFGLGSTYVAQLKAVLLGSLPEANLVDISHSISPQSILEAELSLRATAHIFPSGSVHLMVVDPGVGTQRRPIAIESRGRFFVGPDNGVFGQLAHEPDVRAVVLDKSHIFREPVSNTFHGRDIFAPVAAELAGGLTLDDVGTPIENWLEGSLVKPQRSGSQTLVPLLHADNFGNVLTNLHVRDFPANALILLKDKQLSVFDTYGDAPRNTLVALFGSDGYLELAVRDGSAISVLESDWSSTHLVVEHIS
ncbi:MAG: SAM-dependent chlorinase/fluorinase [Deltaproteobacteria bacterium]|nr:SAM-dependent chlorinase/fluorinase [Deltaproteobacteria bacterium]MBT6434176.1 SAM-dependent chlorinase/fluorinase [Deltaproteobacteria bacterium]MBT6490535.1 SAM-dependent chlorinase/fluorinase [Deltaproteobacteria bacterium]